MLTNSATGKTIIAKTRIADTTFRRFKGLMFKSKENFDYALVFELPSETKFGASIHMMFMNFPIDIIYLDSSKKVVDKATVKPWLLNYTPKNPAKYFIEMPVGYAKGIELGAKIEWI